MKELPILFSSPMVRAILDGQKTQTRRVLKPQPPAETVEVSTYYHPEPRPHFWAYDDTSLLDWSQPCPYGQKGDRLWVRETWARPTTLDPGPTFYHADYPDCVPDHYKNVPPVDAVTWKPSIHMFRRDSRITLEVTDVRVERLQDIRDDDCRAEGCPGGHGSIPGYQYNATPDEHFKWIWESVGGDWVANPWVWVVEFQRIKP